MAIINNEYIDEIQEKAIKLENEIAERKLVETQLRIQEKRRRSSQPGQK